MRQALVIIGSFVLCACLFCGPDAQRCTEPEPGEVPMAYVFRGIVCRCEGCGSCLNAYWYFECCDGSCRYLGNWDPRDQAERPPWFDTVIEAESCFDHGSWECSDSLWGYCSDPSMTPRENREAEEAAICLSGSLVAPQDLYERIVRDLALIRSAYGDSIDHPWEIHFVPYLRSDAMNVALWPAVMARYQRGEYDDLDSLNAHFKVSEIIHFPYKGKMFLTFEGRYNVQRLGQIYSAEPSVEYTDPSLDGGCGYSMGPRCSTVLIWPLQ